MAVLLPPRKTSRQAIFRERVILSIPNLLLSCRIRLIRPWPRTRDARCVRSFTTLRPRHGSVLPPQTRVRSVLPTTFAPWPVYRVTPIRRQPNRACAADVVCDDVLYIDEPMFQDGIVAQGVIDVVNANKTYASSAGNDMGTDGYASVFRSVVNGTGLTAATNSALVGTNINLAGVDSALYAGGFHNFNANGLDVAQTINTDSDAGFFILQWNDPYDTSAPNLISRRFLKATERARRVPK